MKAYISADIEGITGTTHWDEATKSKPDFREFQEQMTAKVAAAYEGALRAGATEILVKDAHASARNILAAKLPREARLVRGWKYCYTPMPQHWSMCRSYLSQATLAFVRKQRRSMPTSRPSLSSRAWATRR
jgi:D-aminopeptidase